MKNKYCQYSILFLIISLFWVSLYIIFGKTMIWEIDGYAQHYGILAKVKDLFASLFSGGGLAFWQWDIGLGGDLIGNLAPVICDPFSLVCLLFPKASLDIGYTVAVVLKLYTAGLIVLMYLKYKNKSISLCIIGAISYAFCSWALVCVVHFFFVSQLVLFPLIIWGIDKVWNKENPILFIVGICVSAAISIYLTYMTAIFVVIYIVVKYFNEREEKTIKYFCSKLLPIVGYTLLGALLACPLIATNLYSLLNVSTESGSTLRLLPSFSELVKIIPGYAGFIDIDGKYAYVAVNGLLLMAIPVIVLLRKKSTYMIMCLVAMVFTIFPIFQSIMNGMSYPTGRWCYSMEFFLVIAIVESLEIILDNPQKYKKPMLVTIVVAGLASLLLTGVFGIVQMGPMITAVVNVCFAIALWYVATKDGDKKNKLKRIKILVVVNIAMFTFTVFSPFIYGRISAFMNQGEPSKGYNACSFSEASKIKDDGFYRTVTYWEPFKGENTPITRTAFCTSLYWGVPSTGEYLSTVDSDWIKYNVELANSGGNFRRMTSLNNDSRCRINFLQGVKYYLSDKKDVHIKDDGIDYDSYADWGFNQIKKSNTKANLFKSKNETGLGYVFDSVVSKKEYLKLDNVKREQLLMNSLVVDDKDIGELSHLRADISKIKYEKDKKIPFSLVEKTSQVRIKKNKINVQEPDQKLIIKPKERIKNAEIYLVFKGLERKGYSERAHYKHLEKQGQTQSKLDKYRYKMLKLDERIENVFTIYAFRQSKNNKKVLKGLYNAADEDQGVQNVEDYIVNLGYVEESQDDIILKFTDEGKYKYDSFELVAVPTKEYDNQASKLSDQRLKTTSIKNDEVNGTVNAKKDGMLYLSIIKNDGWSIYIDGKKADKVYQVDTAFSAVPIKKGHHKIKLVYNIVWFKYTIIATAVGVVIVLVLIVRYFLNRKRRKDRRML